MYTFNSLTIYILIGVILTFILEKSNEKLSTENEEDRVKLNYPLKKETGRKEGRKKERRKEGRRKEGRKKEGRKKEGCDLGNSQECST